MGTITQRESGAWQVKIRRKGMPSKSQTFGSHEDAVKWDRQQEAELDRGVLGMLDGTPLLKDLLKKYRQEITPGKKGYDSETWRLKAMERHWIGACAVGKLSSGLLATYRDERLQEPVSGSTVNRELNLLHHVLEIGRKEWGMGTQVNPVSDVRRPKNNPARDRRMTEDEKAILLEACGKARSSYLAPIVGLALETGMRQSEIVMLDWEQIDLEDGVVNLRAGATKNDERRSVPLSTKAVALLANLGGDRTGRVWPGLTSEAVKRAFIRVRDKAKLLGLTFHDSRHEATSRFVELGLTDTEVMSITGHKTNAMMRRYTHLRAKDLAKKLG